MDLVSLLHSGEPRPYTPHLRVDEEPEGWWVLDGDRRIAFLHRATMAFDPFEITPFGSLGRQAVCHPRYDMCTRINMHLDMVVNVHGNFVIPDAHHAVAWTKRGAALTCRVEQRHSEGVEAVSSVTIGYCPSRAVYTWRLSHEVRDPLLPPYREFCNLYAQHLGNGIPARKKWQYTVWEGYDGQLWKMPQNPCFTFGVRHGGMLRKHVRVGGFIGYGTEADFNPVVVFHDANVPLSSATCDMWGDEHLSYGFPALEAWADGVPTVRIESELVHVPEPLMAKLVAEARPVPVAECELTKAVPGLVWGGIADLDTALDPRVPHAGYVFAPGHDRFVEIGPEESPLGYELRYRSGCGQRAVWEARGSHGHRRCLSLRSEAGQRTGWLACGHTPHVEEGKRYRFAAMVRTEGEAKASLRLANVWHDFYDRSAESVSPAVSGADWQPVEAVVTATDYPALEVWLETYGEGTASFDDLYFGPA